MSTLRTLRNLALLVLLLGGVSTSNPTSAQPGINITFQTFYNELSPYGRWSRNPQYGSVWIPDVPRGFQPYSTNGYWEVTEYGNTWVSEYDWGWAPFHYGRWSYDDYMGWFWIPDYEWGPAWVNWRSGGGYYGWAPLGPGMSINVSINLPSFWWVFVDQRYITSPRWHNYCPPRRRVTHVYNQTVVINNYYHNNNRTYVYGPRRDEIERVTRRSVPVRSIDASERGRGRVIVAESGRRNDRYDTPSRRGSVVEANPGQRDGDNGRDNNRRWDAPDYSNRNGRTEAPDYSNRSGRVVTPDYNNRSSRGDAPDYSNRGGRVEAPDNNNRSSRSETPTYNRNRPESPEFNNRSSRGNDRPTYDNSRSERIERSSPPPVQRERSSRTYDAPSRVERAPSESRGSRAPEGNPGRGGSERSGRGPR